MKADVFFAERSLCDDSHTQLRTIDETQTRPERHHIEPAGQFSSCRFNGEESRMKDYAVLRCLGYYAERPCAQLLLAPGGGEPNVNAQYIPTGIGGERRSVATPSN